MRISTYVDLSNCDFTNANLRGAILSGANLKNADFTNADLTFANLTSSVFQDTILVNADLAGAHLSIHPGSIYANHLVDDHYYPICVDIYGEDWKGRTILMNSADCTGLICPDGQPIGPGDYYPPNYLTQRAPEPCRAI
ncbi:MAG: pentapeptide repeat-containing protein [Euryarchaeota archaeon]|nr:pentapeptide repeat-containing protein [Euryarchaeota archaeon]